MRTECVDVLIEALGKIVNFQPEYVPISEDDRLSMESCAACEECRRRKWPPSQLCSAHYSVVARNQADNDYRRSTQHHGMRDIARAALARIGAP